MIELAEASTLPQYNLMSDPDFSGTLWNYLGSVFSLGSPFLLIAVALLIVEMVLVMIIVAIKKARENDADDYDDGDDW